MWIADEVGLFIQGFLGAVLLSNNVLYGLFVFSFIHYTLIWMTIGGTGAAVMPDLMQWIFTVRMQEVFLWGIFTGCVYASALGTRTLIPAHTWDTTKNEARYGLFLAGFFVMGAIKSILLMLGAHRGGTPYPPDPALPGMLAGYGIFTGLAIIGFGVIIYLTWSPPAPGSFLSIFQLQYDDQKHNRYILFYIGALLLLTVPQAAWDFLVLPPANWELYQAGFLTLGLILVALAAIYWMGEYWLKLDKSHFKPDQSRVSWSTFMLTLTIFLTVLHLYFLVYYQLINVYQEADVGLAIFVIAATVVGIWLNFAFRASGARRLKAYNARRTRRTAAQTQMGTSAGVPSLLVRS